MPIDTHVCWNLSNTSPGIAIRVKAWKLNVPDSLASCYLDTRFFGLLDRIPLCSFHWLQIYSPPASASWVLGFHAWTTLNLYLGFAIWMHSHAIKGRKKVKALGEAHLLDSSLSNSLEHSGRFLQSLVFSNTVFSVYSASKFCSTFITNALSLKVFSHLLYLEYLDEFYCLVWTWLVKSSDVDRVIRVTCWSKMWHPQCMPPEGGLF